MTSSPNPAELDRLLNRDPASVAAWEAAAFDRAAGTSADKIVLFGAGGLGRKTLAGLRKVGIEPLAFSDNNQKVWNTTIDGLAVLPPQEAARKFGADATFVVTVWNGFTRDTMGQRLAALKSLGCKKVVSFAELFWKYPDTFIPHYSLDLPSRFFQHAADVRKAFDLWADDASRNEYMAQIRWRALLDFDGLPNPVTHEIYFPPDLIDLRSDEHFVDCGAFDGDTLAKFIGLRGDSFGSIHAFEPDPRNFQKLQQRHKAWTENIRRKIAIFDCAVGDQPGKVPFSADGTEASFAGKGSTEVDCITLDSMLSPQSASYIKMDIEGFEPAALEGGRQLISNTAPVLAVCSYHKQEHVWQIPLLIRSMSDRFKFFLRPHLREVWDLVCYAIPSDRLK
jgi:FkbM family methyltransferase